MLRRVEESPELLDEIWWSDEATSHMNGTVNRPNCVYYWTTNPNVKEPVKMKSVGITIWAAVSSKVLIGPYFFHKETGNYIGSVFDSCTVNGKNYFKMLKEFFYPHCYDFSDQFFMQDGASPHFAITVRDYLDKKFGCQWIGRGSKLFGVNWPPRSTDLTPCDFGLWGFIREMVYSENPLNLCHLQH